MNPTWGAWEGLAEKAPFFFPTFRGLTGCQALPWALGATKDSDEASVAEVLTASQDRQTGTQIRLTKGLVRC